MLQLPLKTFIYFQSVLPSLYLCQAARLPICRWWNTVFVMKNYTSSSFEELTWLTELCHIHLNNNKQLKANKNLQLSQMSSIISALFVLVRPRSGKRIIFTILYIFKLSFKLKKERTKTWRRNIFFVFHKINDFILTSIRMFRG